MEIKTSRFGLISVEESQCVEFPTGLPGFERLTSFALLDSIQPPYYWLQSLEEEDIAFVLVDPFLIRKDYNPDISDDDLEKLEVSDIDHVLVMAIVTIRQNPEETSINLQGPVLINRDNKRGRQCIIGSDKWKVRHGIMEELGKGGDH